MCCLTVILILLGPRVAFLATWLATNRVAVAFHHGFAVPFLGLIFLPWTALLYTLILFHPSMRVRMAWAIRACLRSQLGSCQSR